TRQIDQFETLYLDLLKRKPDSAIAKKRLIELYLVKKDYDRAKYYIDQVLKNAPEDVDGRYFRGRVFLVERNAQKAYDDLAAAVRGAPRFAPGQYFMGVAALYLNKAAEDKAGFTKAAAREPGAAPHCRGRR